MPVEGTDNIQVNKIHEIISNNGKLHEENETE